MADFSAAAIGRNAQHGGTPSAAMTCLYGGFFPYTINNTFGQSKYALNKSKPQESNYERHIDLTKAPNNHQYQYHTTRKQTKITSTKDYT
ncbi:hypothetical protein TSUD_365900 [Trifolium subterraneum]|uniref:Uncharacterized protein n=1 Tax=Trifolium subterraneum TaxID=3900 RepID=A0A2Z6NIL0_TRISU|nr:hypothetical protein TSUD_365900 [Trifolium subterraneum]